MNQYYKTNSRKLTYGDYWRITSSFRSFVVGCIAKLLGIPIFLSNATVRVDKLILFEPSELPPGTTELFQKTIEECEEHQVRFRFLYLLPVLGKVTGAAAAFVSADGLSFAILGHLRGGRRERTAFAMHSLRKDGTYIGTTNRKKQLEFPPEYVVERFVAASVGTVIQRHYERVASCKDSILPVGDLEAALVETNNHFVDFQVARGVFEPMSQEEVERLRGRGG